MLLESARLFERHTSRQARGYIGPRQPSSGRLSHADCGAAAASVHAKLLSAHAGRSAILLFRLHFGTTRPGSTVAAVTSVRSLFGHASTSGRRDARSNADRPCGTREVVTRSLARRRIGCLPAGYPTASLAGLPGPGAGCNIRAVRPSHCFSTRGGARGRATRRAAAASEPAEPGRGTSLAPYLLPGGTLDAEEARGRRSRCQDQGVD